MDAAPSRAERILVSTKNVICIAKFFKFFTAERKLSALASVHRSNVKQ